MNRNFEELAGIIKLEESVTIEVMDETIAQCTIEPFNDVVESFKISWQEVMRGEYQPIETLWDDIDVENNGE